MTHIRDAQREDARALAALFEHLTGRETSQADVLNRLQLISRSETDWIYVYDNDGIKGVMAFRIRENIEEVSRYGEISVLVVDPEHRCEGIGRELVEYAGSLAKEKGCKGTWLVSGFGREEEAHLFYKKMGFGNNGLRFVKHF